MPKNDPNWHCVSGQIRSEHANDIGAAHGGGCRQPGAPAPRAALLAAIRKVAWEGGCRAGAGPGQANRLDGRGVVAHPISSAVAAA
jgi:hypothetical protein